MNEALDPYRTPQAASLDVLDPVALENAGKGRRLGTFLIDYACFLLASVIVGVLLGIVLGLTVGVDWVTSAGKAFEYLFGLAIMVGYYAFFEGIWGRTPGKWICGTRVVAENGGRPSMGQVLGRTFSRFIPFEAFSLLFSDKNLGWHDTLPKTRVVLAKPRVAA